MIKHTMCPKCGSDKIHKSKKNICKKCFKVFEGGG